MHPDYLKAVASIVLSGWLGTFLVTGILVAAVAFLNRFPDSK